MSDELNLEKEELAFLEEHKAAVEKLKRYGKLIKTVIEEHLRDGTKGLGKRIQEALEELTNKHKVPLVSDIDGPYYEGLCDGGPTRIRMGRTMDPKFNNLGYEDGATIPIEDGKVIWLGIGGKYRPIEKDYWMNVHYEWGFTDPDQQQGLLHDRRSSH